MIEYRVYAELSQASDSDSRGHAAHLAALAYLDYSGPADEHAALYAALIGFLDDPSVKVRAALAYGLLHSAEAPRPIILALLQDSPIISRAVLQYSPVLVDADLIGPVRQAELPVIVAIAQRQKLSPRIAAALIARGHKSLSLRLLRRKEICIAANVLSELAISLGEDAELRGALLARHELPAPARLVLVQCATESLRQCRLVKGALPVDRLDRLLRNSADTALSVIGEAAAMQSRQDYVAALVGTDQLNSRRLLHAVVTGNVMFFSACIATLANASRDKVFTLLETGSRAALHALFVRCGLDPAICRLLVRMILHARTADLADDVSARHYVVTALTEELIAEYAGAIPEELEEAFAYLSEQNIALARKAARGVMAAFAGASNKVLPLPRRDEPDRLSLPAA